MNELPNASEAAPLARAAAVAEMYRAAANGGQSDTADAIEGILAHFNAYREQVKAELARLRTNTALHALNGDETATYLEFSVAAARLSIDLNP